MIRFASLDLDGTALESSGRSVSFGLFEGVERWRGLGVTWHVVTGRPAVALSDISGMDNLLRVCAPTLLVDDAEVEIDCKGGTAKALATLDDETVDRILATCPDVVVSRLGRLAATSRQAARFHALTYRIPQRWIAMAPERGTVNRLTIYGSLLDRTHWGDGIDVRPISAFNGAVVTVARMGKSVGYAQHLERHHDGVLSENIAFGDDEGDALLLAQSVVGVAVRNASAEAKAAATVRLTVDLASFLATTDPSDLDPQ